jgi:hypothetical protein
MRQDVIIRVKRLIDVDPHVGVCGMRSDRFHVNCTSLVSEINPAVPVVVNLRVDPILNSENPTNSPFAENT